jgi:hypothetical protein
MNAMITLENLPAEVRAIEYVGYEGSLESVAAASGRPHVPPLSFQSSLVFGGETPSSHQALWLSRFASDDPVAFSRSGDLDPM